MALVVADRVKETTTSTGTGAISLGGAEPNFRTFSSVLSDADTTYYAIIDDSNLAFEVGLGTYASSGNTITRTTVLASSNSNNAVSFSAGTKDVFLTYPADKSVNRDASGNVSVSGGVTATSFTGNITGNVTGNVTGAVTATQVDLTGQGDLRLQDASGGQYVALQAPATVGSSFTFTLPSADGSADQLLKTDGSGNLSFATINAAPSITATASGTLANGDTVIVNANGTVSAVAASVSTTPSAGTPVQFESGQTIYISAGYDATSGKIVIAYRDDGNSGYGTAVVGTVSGTSISFGTPVVFESANSAYVAIATGEDSSRVVIAYRDNGNSNYVTAIVGTISGTSISFGSAEVVEVGPAATDIAATYDASAGRIIVVYRDNANNRGLAKAGSVSGTSISFGSATEFNSGNAYYNSVVYHANAQKFVIAYQDAGNSNYGTAIVGTVSGSSISFGTKAVFESASTLYTSIAYDANAQKVVIAYEDDDNGDYGTAVVGTVSGTSISFGTPVVFESANTKYQAIAYDSNAQKVLICYTDDGNGGAGTAITGTVSGTSISFGTPAVFESGDATYIALAYDSSAQKFVTACRDNDDSYKGKSAVVTATTTSTNLTSENYIGISDAAYSDGATATVQIVGSVDDAQSSLTPGQQYFVQLDGSLGTTAADPSVFAGTAVAATKVIVKG